MTFICMSFSSFNRGLTDFQTTVFQVLSKEDFETLNLCKSMMDRGECPPLMVVFDPQEG